MSDYPDFTITALLKGIYAGDPKALSVDVQGNIIAMLKALHGLVPTTLQCDVDGNMQINVVAQELAEIINRAKFGAPDQVIASEDLAEGATATLFEILGKGQIYACTCVIAGVISVDDKITLIMDGETISELTLPVMFAYGMLKGTNLPICFTRYSIVDHLISASLTPGYTFENQYKVVYYHGFVPGVENVLVSTLTYYSLI